MSDRTATVRRETGETTISVELGIDGAGTATVDTGIGFLDHMLDSFATHGLFDLVVDATGDLGVDEHHTVEDVGIVLGRAFDEALGDRGGIVRFADRRVPMDEALAVVAVDISGRPLFEFTGEYTHERVGEFTSDLATHFWRSMVMNAGITCHARITGENGHHEIEALFKGFARVLDDATASDDRRAAAPSTKGALE